MQGKRYKPYGKGKVILDRAMEHIQSVEYQVSIRWVFYRLLQEGHYNKKSDYTTFCSLTSRARKSWYDGWTPEILSDDTRAMDLFETTGERPNPNIEDLIKSGIEEAKGDIEFYQNMLSEYEYECPYHVDPKYYHDNICLIMFEARAMHQQFKQYTHGLTLCPFGGQPSIPYKWSIAKHIESQCLKYGKDAIVFYYGDLDDAGLTIFNAAKEDISDWCDADIEFIRCGLSEEQVRKYEVPENFEHPGSYQWEALTDAAAKQIIEDSLSGFFNFYQARDMARRDSDVIASQVNEAVNNYLLSY